MRIILTSLAVLLTVAVLAAGGLFLWGYQTYQGPGPLDKPVIVTLEKGLGVSAIANRLSSANIIADPVLFRVIARVSGDQTKLQAGEYRFEPSITMAGVFDKLTSGDVVERQITIPEGLTSWQIVNILNQSDILDGDPLTDIPDEGSLLPETYHVTAGQARQALIDRMQTAMTRTLNDLWSQRQDDLPVNSKAEALILASIIEKETAVPDERDTVAGVFVNRLRRGMALQTDPTVIYALTQGKIEDEGMGPLGRRLLRKDLKVDSPYNTYRYPGLPPGPIANPGRESIAAALNPAEHDYIYFVADGSGGHAFAKTLKEHNRNVAQWRKIRRSTGQ